MLAKKGKISTRQAALLFYVITLSPEIRLFPQNTVKMAGKAGWLAPVVAIAPTLLLVVLVNSFFKKNQNANLSDIYNIALGKVVGKIVVSLYLIWILILTSLYIRYYAERLLSSILPHTSLVFIILIMLILVFFAVRNGLVPLARVNELFFGMLIVSAILLYILALPDIEYRNIMTVCTSDAWPVIKASSSIIPIWGYFLFIFFLGDRINDKENIKKFGFKILLVKFIITIIMLIVTIGSLSATAISNIALPFFAMVKDIEILDTFERMESIIFSIWVITDFITITVFSFIAVSMLKSIFKLKEGKFLASPILLIIGIGSLFFFKDIFELEAFSNYIGLPINALLTVIIPITVFIIGKLREKI